jgi:peptide deformylase
MPIRKIVRYPDPILRQVSEPISDPASVRGLVQDMAETMYSRSGVGLAAIQVGEPVRLFIIDAAMAGGTEEDPPIVLINPEIVELSPETETSDEGCLSFPEIYVPVKRSLRARIRATDLEGNMFEMEGEDLLARAFQHENDHLNGKLLADFVGRIKRQLIERKLSKMEASEQASG